LLSSLYFNCSTSPSSTKTATPDPTPCKVMLPSVYAWIVCSLYSLVSVILTASVECGQLLSSTSLSKKGVWLLFPYLTIYF
jgi:hypothetical protein